jgi:hypothetical protein
MAVVDVSFPGNLSQVANLADLRALPSSYLREDAYLVTGLGIYTFDGGSVAADDNASVIRPNDRGPLQAGRWIGAAAAAGDNIFTTYAALIASDGAKKSALLVPQAGETEPAGTFNYINGAWVRQGASGIAYGTRTAQAKLDETISVLDKGADPSGNLDSSAAINAAVAAGSNIFFPPGTYSVSQPIDLRGQKARLFAVPDTVTIRATTGMEYLINAEEGAEVSSYSPLSIEGLKLDGANLVSNANLSIRFRRDYTLVDVFSSNAPRGFRAKDANSGSMRRCRTSAVQIALHSEGSNHATHHDGCSFVNASQTAVLIENKGTALDGNNGLVFTACIVQDGTGDGFDVAPSTSANLVGCYVGETTTGFNYVNRGGVITVDGGITYFGFTPSNYVTRPLGGTTYLEKVQLFSQNEARGTAWLSGLTPTEGNSMPGKIKLKDCNAQFPVAGNVFLNGNVLASDTIRVFAPRLGKSYTVETNDLTATSTLSGSFMNSRTVTVDSVTGPSPILGLQAALTGQSDWRDGEPFYLAVVYSASKDVNVRTNTAVLGAGVTTIGTMPASAAMATYVKVESIATSATQTILEFYMTGAAVGDNITLHYVGLADAAMIKNGIGVMPNLYLP